MKPLTLLFVLIFTLTACSTIKEKIEIVHKAVINKKETSTAKSVQVIPNGPDLERLQRLLTHKGYRLGTIDGKRGSKTTKAIKAYQRANRLNDDGIASFQLLTHLGSTISSPDTSSVLGLGTSPVQCLTSSGSAELDKLTSVVFASILDDLQLDLDNYLSGFCIPDDRNQLAKLYIFLVTEGVIHSRIATTKYNELLDVFEKAGVEIAVDKDGLRRSTEVNLRTDIREAAQNRIEGLSALVNNSFDVDDNAEFQKQLERAYNNIDSKSPYKEKARQLLAKVLVHSSSSTFYLVRSGYTIDKLSNYFGINISDGLSLAEKAVMFANQLVINYELALFIISQQGDLSDMLIASTYNFRALIQDIKDIPRLDSRQATQEVRRMKAEEGFIMDEFEMGFNSDNSPISISRGLS